MNYLSLFLNATLEITNTQEKQIRLQITRSPVGEMRDPIIRPFDPQTFLEAANHPLNFGKILFDTLFPTDTPTHLNVRDFLLRSLDLAGEGQTGRTALRLCLNLSPELQIYPWELMVFTRNGGESTPSDFLALDSRLSLVRYESLTVPPGTKTQQGPVRCLFAAASPLSAVLPSLDLATVKASLVKFSRNSPNLHLESLVPATLDGLVQSLKTHPTPVFVFYGHGFFPNDVQSLEPGRIFLELPSGAEEAFTADDLSILLRNAGVRLAIFVSCSGAGRSENRFWTGIAPALQNSGVEAVIAMQAGISEAAGQHFVESLLENLGTVATVDEAMQLSRESLSRLRTLDWYRPVLYSRSETGRLFDFDTPSPAMAEPGIKVSLKTGNVHGEATGISLNEPWSGRADLEGTFETVYGHITGLIASEGMGGNAKVRMTTGDVEKGASIVGAVIGRPSNSRSGSFTQNADINLENRGETRGFFSRKKQVDFAIMTPIPKEYVEIKKILERPSPVLNSIYPATQGQIGGYSAICMQLGKGEADAAVGMANCIKDWKPRWVILAGIAGSLNSRKLNRGDILVANHVFSLDFGKIENGRFLRRPDNDLRLDASLLGYAETFYEEDSDWKRRIASPRPSEMEPGESKVVFGNCLSGNQVIDDLGYDLVRDARITAPEALGIEMEAVGVGAAIRRAQAERPIGLLMVRGISDEVEVSGEAGSAGAGTAHRTLWKQYVTGAVAAFIRGYLEYLPLERT